MKGVFRRVSIPLAFYYAVTLALPLANGAAGSAFLRHALVVLAVPPALIGLLCAVRKSVLFALGRPRNRPSLTFRAQPSRPVRLPTLSPEAGRSYADRV